MILQQQQQQKKEKKCVHDEFLKSRFEKCEYEKKFIILVLFLFFFLFCCVAISFQHFI